MNRFAVAIPYFGRIKDSFPLFLASCARNPDVDWIFFTDCKAPCQLSQNITWNITTFEEIQKLAQQKLHTEVRLQRPYKLCDLKPFWGIILSEYLMDYEYWGYGDTDVIYGRITKALDKIDYKQYDKINWMGHLCFIRNSPNCNHAVYTETENTISWKYVMQTERNLGFDERDANVKFIANGLKIYTGSLAADIDIFYGRMRCVDKKTLRFLLDTKGIKYAPTNYRKQIFAVLDGITYRVYIKNQKVYKEEFAYVHFRKEAPILIPAEATSFLITRAGFIPLTDESCLETYNTVNKYIAQYNPQNRWFSDIYTFLYQYYRKISGKRGW